MGRIGDQGSDRVEGYHLYEAFQQEGDDSTWTLHELIIPSEPESAALADHQIRDLMDGYTLLDKFSSDDKKFFGKFIKEAYVDIVKIGGDPDLQNLDPKDLLNTPKGLHIVEGILKGIGIPTRLAKDAIEALEEAQEVDFIPIPSGSVVPDKELKEALGMIGGIVKGLQSIGKVTEQVIKRIAIAQIKEKIKEMESELPGLAKKDKKQAAKEIKRLKIWTRKQEKKMNEHGVSLGFSVGKTATSVTKTIMKGVASLAGTASTLTKSLKPALQGLSVAGDAIEIGAGIHEVIQEVKAGRRLEEWSRDIHDKLAVKKPLIYKQNIQKLSKDLGLKGPDSDTIVENYAEEFIAQEGIDLKNWRVNERNQAIETLIKSRYDEILDYAKTQIEGDLYDPKAEEAVVLHLEKMKEVDRNQFEEHREEIKEKIKILAKTKQDIGKAIKQELGLDLSEINEILLSKGANEIKGVEDIKRTDVLSLLARLYVGKKQAMSTLTKNSLKTLAAEKAQISKRFANFKKFLAVTGLVLGIIGLAATIASIVLFPPAIIGYIGIGLTVIGIMLMVTEHLYERGQKPDVARIKTVKNRIRHIWNHVGKKFNELRLQRIESPHLARIKKFDHIVKTLGDLIAQPDNLDHDYLKIFGIDRNDQEPVAKLEALRDALVLQNTKLKSSVEEKMAPLKERIAGLEKRMRPYKQERRAAAWIDYNNMIRKRRGIEPQSAVRMLLERREGKPGDYQELLEEFPAILAGNLDKETKKFLEHEMKITIDENVSEEKLKLQLERGLEKFLTMSYHHLKAFLKDRKHTHEAKQELKPKQSA